MPAGPRPRPGSLAQSKGTDELVTDTRMTRVATVVEGSGLAKMSPSCLARRPGDHLGVSTLCHRKLPLTLSAGGKSRDTRAAALS